MAANLMAALMVLLPTIGAVLAFYLHRSGNFVAVRHRPRATRRWDQSFSIERGVDRGEVLAAKKKTEQEHCNLPNGQGAIAAPCRGAERGTLYSS